MKFSRNVANCSACPWTPNTKHVFKYAGCSGTDCILKKHYLVGNTTIYHMCTKWRNTHHYRVCAILFLKLRCKVNENMRKEGELLSILTPTFLFDLIYKMIRGSSEVPVAGNSTHRYVPAGVLKRWYPSPCIAMYLIMISSKHNCKTGKRNSRWHAFFCRSL